MREAARRAAAERAYVHTLDVLIVAGQLSTAVHAALRGKRGYLLTHDRRFLRPYDAARVAIPRATAGLAALTRDDAAQRVHVAALRTRMDAYLALLATTVALERDGRGDAARAMVRAGLGRDRVTGVLDALAHYLS